MSGRKVALDTNVLGWALRDRLTESDRPKKVRAERLFNRLREEKATIVLPTVVLFELLCVYSDSEKDTNDKIQFLDKLSKHCQIAHLDELAALKAASYFNATSSGTCGYDASEREKSKRKADVMILGQAACNGVSELITNDSGFIKLAKALNDTNKCNISVIDIPEDAQQVLDEVIDM